MKIAKKVVEMDKRMTELEESLRAAASVMEEYEKDKAAKEKKLNRSKIRERILVSLLLSTNIFWLVLIYAIRQN